MGDCLLALNATGVSRVDHSGKQHKLRVGSVDDLELRHDIRESTKVLEHESADRIDSLEHLRHMQNIAGVPRALGDMTEDEATALAIMLSQEEEEAKQIGLSLDESMEDLEHLRLDEEDYDEDSFNLDSRYHHRHFAHSPSLTSGHPREAGPSFLASPDIQPEGSPLSSSYRSSSNNKVQLSPRLYPQSYGSPRSPSPIPELDNLGPAAWPLPSPVGRTPSPSFGPSQAASTSIALDRAQSKWSTWVKKDSAYAPSVSNEPKPSLLTRQIPQPEPLPDEDMDEELRFVLELSRAEEESRQAARAI